jgi:phosphoribosyl 1,2-cyclic phosphate phosphodiesterase
MTSTTRVTVLGCGSSGGVPRANGDWGVCDPSEPRNRRRRCSMLVQRWNGPPGDREAATTVLIDTAPDLREQLIEAGVTRLDGVLFTHAHADQAHGIDDLRAIAYANRARVRVWMDAPTTDDLVPRFRYCFEGSNGYPPILKEMPTLEAFGAVTIDGPGGVIEALPLPQDHGGGPSMGFRFGDWAYSNDVVALPEETFAALGGLQLWFVDALRETPHPTHSHLAQSLAWRERLRPARTVLTNLHIDLDYQALVQRLPEGVEPAFDGQTFDLTNP